MQSKNSLTPQVSVVMTVYNCEKFTAQAIESILNQTFTNFELIIVDDASTDATKSIIQSFKDPRIHYFVNPVNIGQTKSLNVGIRQSKGQYIARMDADDIAYPKRLEVQYDFMERHPEISVLGSWSEDIDESGKVLRKVCPPTDSVQIKCFMAGSGDLSYWCITHPTVMMRFDALKDAGFYCDGQDAKQGYPQDYELWSRLIRKNNFANIRQVLLKYRILRNSDSRFFKPEQVKMREVIMLDQIKHYLPSLSDKDASVLLKMLEFQKQEGVEGGERVFDLFEKYFKNFLGPSFKLPAVQLNFKRMQLYYIPRLFITNKARALTQFLRIIIRYPFLVADMKFYRKCFKVMCEIFFSNQYPNWVRKFLIYR